MLVRQLAVARDPGIAHRPVDPGLHLHRARPSVRDETGAQRGQMGFPHVHQAALLHAQAPAGLVLVDRPAGQRAVPQVQGLPVLREVRVVGGEPGAGSRVGGTDPVAQREPVGQVDHVLVLDGAAPHGGEEPVVAAGGVGARVVRGPGRHLGRRAAGGEVAVAERAQRFAQPFRGRVVPLVRPGPRPRHAPSPDVSSSPGSLTTTSAPRRRSAVALYGPAVRSTPVSYTHL